MKNKFNAFERRAGYMSIIVSRYEGQMFDEMQKLLVKEEGTYTSLANNWQIPYSKDLQDYYISSTKSMQRSMGFLLNKNSPHYLHMTRTIIGLHQVLSQS